MNPKLSKESILQACFIKQQLTVEDFEKEMAQMQVEMTAHAETASQDQKSHREENELLVRMENELIVLKSELLTLERIDPSHTSQEIELGSVVVTDQRVFFISIAVESIEVNGQDVFGLSVQAPIFQALRGKKVGDQIDFRGQHYQILEIY